MARLKFILLFPLILLMSFSSEPDEYILGVIKEHKASVTSVAFSPDDKYLASGGESKMLLISDPKTLETIYRYDDNYYPTKAIEMTFTDKLFVSSGPDIKLINLENQTLAVLKGNATHIWSIDYAPERNKITAGSYDYTIKVWDVETQHIDFTLEGHKKSTLPVAFSPDEKYLVSGSLDKTIRVWNAQTGELMKILEMHTGNIYDVEFHPSGKFFASASRDKTIRLWDFETGKVIVTYTGHEMGVLDIEFLPDGNHLVSASFDGTIRLWQTMTGKMVYTFIGHEGAVNALDVSPNGELMASGGADSKVIIWSLSKKLLAE